MAPPGDDGLWARAALAPDDGRMTVTEVLVLTVVAIVAAAGLCWFAVAMAVRRVRRERKGQAGGARTDSV